MPAVQVGGAIVPTLQSSLCFVCLVCRRGVGTDRLTLHRTGGRTAVSACTSVVLQSCSARLSGPGTDVSRVHVTVSAQLAKVRPRTMQEREGNKDRNCVVEQDCTCVCVCVFGFVFVAYRAYIGGTSAPQGSSKETISRET